jgi:hypothetical protein
VTSWIMPDSPAGIELDAPHRGQQRRHPGVAPDHVCLTGRSREGIGALLGLRAQKKRADPVASLAALISVRLNSAVLAGLETWGQPAYCAVSRLRRL